MTKKRMSLAVLLIAVAACMLAAGCAAPSRRTKPPADVPASFSESGREQAPLRWWRSFGDAGLNRLVEQSLQGNMTLESAWYRLREAQAVVDREAAALIPVLDAEAQARVRRSESQTTKRMQFALAAGYEIDLWGRIRSSVEAQGHRLVATREDYRAAALTVAAEVAERWFELKAALGQKALLSAQIDADQKVLEMIRSRFGNGVVRSVDILRQEQLVEATRELRIAQQARIEVLEHQLAVLTGRPPQEGVNLPRIAQLPQRPPMPATGLPCELIRRRPDVRRAYHLLRAADRDLAAAVSDRYPRLTLSASLSTTESDASDLFDDWIATLAANLLAPLIDGGERRAEVRRNEALRNRRLHEWAQASLDAFREVENALAREKRQAERIESLRRQVRLARQSYERLRNEYFNGVSDYIAVLSALTEKQRLRRDLIEARRQLLEFRIALYRALSGGFEVQRQDAPSRSADL